MTDPSGSGVAEISRELGRLDVFSYWTVPSGSLSRAGDLIVAGATGVFLIAARPAAGAFSLSRGRPVVENEPIPGVRALRSDAKRLSARLSASSVFGSVEPVVCLTSATMGMPRTVKGVRILSIGELVKDLTARPRVMEQIRVQRAARVLGVQIPGDSKRHFA
jgi:hypothetical protein